MKTIHQTAVIKNAKPDQVYQALVDSVKHSEFTGAKAEIGKEVGDKFVIYGGHLNGENKELVPNKKIVQMWRADDFPEGHFSEVTFELKEVEDGTEIDFTQTMVPEKSYDHLSDGWKKMYWEKLNKYFSK